MKKAFIILLSSICYQTNAQVGINTTSPNVTLDIEYSTTETPNGVLIPRVTIEQLEADNDKYDVPQNGALIYVTEGIGSTNKTSNIHRPGFYHYNASSFTWELNENEPWRTNPSGYPATSNTESIYQIGEVGIGGSAIDPSSQLDITSNSKGVLIPRLSTDQRNKIVTPANGLLIFNTTTNCLNYYNSDTNKWLSMCGTYDPSRFNLLNCDPPTGALGTYTQGTSLSNNNTYTVSLNITDPGTYEILLNTANGYSFSKSGTFMESGNQTIVLEGQGTPVVGPGTNPVSVRFNGIDVVPNCTLPSVNVLGATTSFIVDCGNITVAGDYSNGVPANGSNYIDVPISSVITAGNVSIETAYVNGIRFSSGSINITSSTQSIRLYAQGTPTSVGTYSYSLTVPGSGSPCAFSVLAKSSTGTFSSPANRCRDILIEEPTSQDGYYWVKDASNNKYKTYCDMSNGGWTLVKSLSERTILVVEKKQSESIGSQGARNVVTTQNGKFNEYAFSVPSAVVNNVGNGLGNKEFRFTIKEKGHTTQVNATVEDIENSTIAPVDDVWTNNNYWDVTIYNGNPATGNFASNTSNNTHNGKLFGYTFGKPTTSSNNYFFNGSQFRINPPGMYSQANFFTGFYGAISYVAGSRVGNDLNYTSTNGAQVTFNKYDINDLFGIYMNLERQLNHHIGTCANSSDDYGGESFCALGWSNWRAHRFNLNASNNEYEGRIVQYWVK